MIVLFKGTSWFLIEELLAGLKLCTKWLLMKLENEN